jgi:hypothetical protein
MTRSSLFAAVVALSVMGCGAPGESRVFLMSIDSSPLYDGQTTEGCPGYVDEAPTETTDETWAGAGAADNWSFFDGWDGVTLLSGSAINAGFGYVKGTPAFGDNVPDYIESTDGKTFTGKVTRVHTNKDAENLQIAETNTVTVVFDEVGAQLRGSYHFEYVRTCTGGSTGLCEAAAARPISCKSGAATFVGRQVASDTVNVSALGY